MLSFFVKKYGGSGFTPTSCLYIQTICLPQLKQGLLILAFTSLLYIRFLHLPILSYERKFISLPRLMQFAWHPTAILLRLVVRWSAYRFSYESAFAPFSIGTEFLPLSSPNPPIPHISVGRLFNFQGTRKFNLPYIPRHKKSQIFQKNKNFLKIFSLAKTTKK